MKYIIVFDDTVTKSELISDVIGNKGFAQVVVKRQTLLDRFTESIKKTYKDAEIMYVSAKYEFNALLDSLPNGSLAKVCHVFANYIISDEEKAALTFEKLQFVEDTLAINLEDSIAAVMFGSVAEYIDSIKNIIGDDINSTEYFEKNVVKKTCIEGITDISEINNFIQCISGNFDARYFNSLKGNQYTIVKSSTNKNKIKAEYTFWHLLPEDMQSWFVEPFNYVEDESQASYTMERLHMTDLAIKWVHGSIDEEEFEQILDKYFYFFGQRHSKDISVDDYKKVADNLYVDKVLSRVEELKKLPQFEAMAQLLSVNNQMTLDDIVKKYISLKEKLESQITQKNISVIGHGDPCFANTMYNKSTRTLKFIDPKGALTEEELWTNPYYDIAKLSHSICGRYDFFNNALFEITINDDFNTELSIDFDNKNYIELFKKKLEENGYDYSLTRLYEASLFISMLPLHIDNPRKVYGFILNAVNILEEIEKNV